MTDEVQTLVTGVRELVGCEASVLAVELRQGKALLRLTEEMWDGIGDALASNPDDAGDLDYFMSVVLRNAGFGRGFSGAVAFLEWQPGRESAIVASRGVVSASFVLDRTEEGASQSPADGAVNAALRSIGVVRDEWPDERAAVGLEMP
ncbi:hypothetical protein AB0F96_13405 [Streptomyces sp. NPDC023998]|uniref:hypothetical protein n=1 Tax=Streptomyces sp. NPDC023998 TaxID=3154597 RepID=UPI0033E6878D